MSTLTSHCLDFYINGTWVKPKEPESFAAENPATEEAYATIAMAGRADIDRAVDAARRAFVTYAFESQAARVALLSRILEGCEKRAEELARAMTIEMGAPISLSRDGQVACANRAFEVTIDYLKKFSFSIERGSTRIFKEPVGVSALITPWNWPLLQIVGKVGPALAAGCTVVLKPSELAPLSGLIFAEIIAEAGVPAGVFNLVNGSGPVVGQALAGHPGVDAVSLTGSTRAGVAVAREASASVKRVALELGGKSPNIILPDANIEAAVRSGVEDCFNNSGQNCNALTRMLVAEHEMSRAIGVAQSAAEAQIVGDPLDPRTMLGPLANRAQFERVQRLIELGVSEGATLVTGGPGRPRGLTRGYYVRPTVFANVTPGMTIAKEEIFGPVLSIMAYKSEEQAVEIANDSAYGLAANVSSGDLQRARRVAARLRVGRVTLNGAPWDCSAPFGGYKQSGYGREYGDFGIEEYLEVKSVIGFEPPSNR
jgi:aldehyde dehydrogenase (NAD+)